MSEQDSRTSDSLLTESNVIAKECAAHLALSIQCATRCSNQAAEGIVRSIEMYVDLLIQRERARQMRS